MSDEPRSVNGIVYDAEIISVKYYNIGPQFNVYPKVNIFYCAISKLWRGEAGGIGPMMCNISQHELLVSLLI